MNMKKTAIFAIAVLLLVPVSVSAAKFSASKTGEQVVEGHTVFTVLEKRNVEQGFDIVIKVREKVQGPNVLWFNDQWKTFFNEDRQPCGGYVIATPTGIPLNSLLAQATIGINGITQPLGLGITYIESYHITDPNGHPWDTDLYALTGVYGRTIPVWISSIHNQEMDDDGIASCDGKQDLAAHDDPGENGVCYYASVPAPCVDIPIREYNADIFGLWKDVTADAVTKEHGDGGADDGDGTGCEITTEWDCTTPAGKGDDSEGNSHPYNPFYAGSGLQHTHETARLDVFFFSELGTFNNLGGGYPPNPRNYVVSDTNAQEPLNLPCVDANGFMPHTASPSGCGIGI